MFGEVAESITTSSHLNLQGDAGLPFLSLPLVQALKAIKSNKHVNLMLLF